MTNGFATRARPASPGAGTALSRLSVVRHAVIDKSVAVAGQRADPCSLAASGNSADRRSHTRTAGHDRYDRPVDRPCSTSRRSTYTRGSASTLPRPHHAHAIHAVIGWRNVSSHGLPARGGRCAAGWIRRLIAIRRRETARTPGNRRHGSHCHCDLPLASSRFHVYDCSLTNRHLTGRSRVAGRLPMQARSPPND